VLLALGPLQLDTTVRTVVVGVVDGADLTGVAQPVNGADALWLRAPCTPEQAAVVCRDGGLPVGVTVDDLEMLDELVAAGAVAIESTSPDAVAAAAARRLSLWCTPAQAHQARRAGVDGAHIVQEPGAPDAGGVPGTTVEGYGPATWGAVARAVHDGCRAVRTVDVRSVRRVVTVADRLLAATGDRAVTA
jgi:hypothetical protein